MILPVLESTPIQKFVYKGPSATNEINILTALHKF